jgi:ribosome-associated translation inhibitor RaiA
MTYSLRITFHHVERSDAIEAYVRKRAEKMETFAADIIGCSVAIEAPHQHKHHGRPQLVPFRLLALPPLDALSPQGDR